MTDSQAVLLSLSAVGTGDLLFGSYVLVVVLCNAAASTQAAVSLTALSGARAGFRRALSLRYISQIVGVTDRVAIVIRPDALLKIATAEIGLPRGGTSLHQGHHVKTLQGLDLARQAQRSRINGIEAHCRDDFANPFFRRTII